MDFSKEWKIEKVFVWAYSSVVDHLPCIGGILFKVEKGSEFLILK